MIAAEQLAFVFDEEAETSLGRPSLAGVPVVEVARHAIGLIRKDNPPVSERWDLLAAVVGWREADE